MASTVTITTSSISGRKKPAASSSFADGTVASSQASPLLIGLMQPLRQLGDGIVDELAFALGVERVGEDAADGGDRHVDGGVPHVGGGPAFGKRDLLHGEPLAAL